jgi:hypothetical protein
MPIKEGLQLVGSAFTPFSHDPNFIFPAPLKTLEPDALRRATQTGTVFMDRAASCQVGYQEGHHEISIWHIGLMFAEYLAGMLAKKAEDGHCRSHKKPCALTRELHLRMLARFKADLLALVKEIEDIETTEVPTWPAANPPPAKNRE